MGRLVEATIECLAERGYAATSTAAVCARAGVSQGALFRHFPTRQALLVATAQHVAERNVAAFAAPSGSLSTSLGSTPVDSVDEVCAVLEHLRQVVLSPANQTWRELLVAARADADLRTALLPARHDLQERMLVAAHELWGARIPADDQAAVLSLVVNFFDGLAFSALDPTPTAPAGRTVERALRLLAEMIVAHYPQAQSHDPQSHDPQENP